MKMRLPVILFALLVASLLAWLIGSRKYPSKSSMPSRWALQVADLEELGSYGHIMASRYSRYADAAAAGHAADAERLFRALAHSEQVHEMNCADAVRRLGGFYRPPSHVVVLRGGTAANLARALEEERTHYPFYRDAIDESFRAGNRYAARVLIRVAGGDMRHIELLECFIRHPDHDGYAVCPLCGNVFRLSCCDYYCPFCLTPEREFVRFD